VFVHAGVGLLRTVAIRPVTLYGEADSRLIPDTINLAVLNKGYIPCVGTMKTKSQFMYVGNAAWALLCIHANLAQISIQVDLKKIF
jgi:nucleoside-diphosphate-sugar epimerase